MKILNKSTLRNITGPLSIAIDRIDSTSEISMSDKELDLLMKSITLDEIQLTKIAEEFDDTTDAREEPYVSYYEKHHARDRASKELEYNALTNWLYDLEQDQVDVAYILGHFESPLRNAPPISFRMIQSYLKEACGEHLLMALPDGMTYRILRLTHTLDGNYSKIRKWVLQHKGHTIIVSTLLIDIPTIDEDTANNYLDTLAAEGIVEYVDDGNINYGTSYRRYKVLDTKPSTSDNTDTPHAKYNDTPYDKLVAWIREFDSARTLTLKLLGTYRRTHLSGLSDEQWANLLYKVERTGILTRVSGPIPGYTVNVLFASELTYREFVDWVRSHPCDTITIRDIDAYQQRGAFPLTDDIMADLLDIAIRGNIIREDSSDGRMKYQVVKHN